MISLYIHIPFCDRQCSYCSFHIMPTSELWNDKKQSLYDQYTQALLTHIKESSKALSRPSLQTIYFWWWTPSILWSQRLKQIIECVRENFCTEHVAELSIELNPFPRENVTDVIKNLNTYCKVFPRVRYSFGIQTFDSEILSEAHREASFPALVEFLRSLPALKEPNNVYNLDFIAFGKRNKTRKWKKILWDQARQSFFQDLVASQMADSFSLYCLELFAWAPRYDGTDLQQQQHYGDVDDMMDEYDRLRETIQDAGYRRYELSNYSVAWRNSLHNRAYRQQENYLALWTWATSAFFKKNWSDLYHARCDYMDLPALESAALRTTNTKHIMKYIAWERTLTDSDILSLEEVEKEACMLSLRTDKGLDLTDISQTQHFEKDYEAKIQEREEQWFVYISDDRLYLTDTGMDVYNTIINELVV